MILRRKIAWSFRTETPLRRRVSISSRSAPAAPGSPFHPRAHRPWPRPPAGTKLCRASHLGPSSPTLNRENPAQRTWKESTGVRHSPSSVSTPAFTSSTSELRGLLIPNDVGRSRSQPV